MPETPELLDLGSIQSAPGSVRRRNRVGRGRASGSGKTANRGHNGEGQRSGRSSKRGFEGGQMPLCRRIPKYRTFPQPNKRVWAILNVNDLEALLEKGNKTLSYQQLAIKGVLARKHDGLRLLGDGDASKALKGITIQAHYASPTAQEKLAAVGAKLEMVTDQPMAKLLLA
jgi:large subunit ribosomal protein L15